MAKVLATAAECFGGSGSYQEYHLAQQMNAQLNLAAHQTWNALRQVCEGDLEEKKPMGILSQLRHEIEAWHGDILRS